MKTEKLFYFYLNEKLIQYKVTFSSKITSKIYVKVPSNASDYDFEVRAPFSVTTSKIESIIKNNYLKLATIKHKKDNNKFINLNTNQMMYLGQIHDFVVIDNQKSNKVKMADNKFYIFKKQDANIKDVIYIFFKKQATKLIPHMVDIKATNYNLTYSEVKIRKLKKAWGNCKWRSKVLTFSFYLMHFDIKTIEYVISHELAHLIYPNHSKDFWNTVQTMFPNYKYSKKILKEFII